MPASLRRSSVAVLCATLLTAGCQQEPAPEKAANEAAASNLPVKPGVYGNVQPSGGMELQIYGPPRDMLEITLCKGPCTGINRARYQVAPGALTFQSQKIGASADAKPIAFRVSQQGEDLKVQSEWTGSQPVILKRLSKRTALAAAQEAILRGGK
jgi:hypothetical protein